jgi:hypothetical protein
MIVYRPFGILILSLTYLISGLIAIPGVAFIASHYPPAIVAQTAPGVWPESVVILVLVLIGIPLALSYGLWNGQRWSWFVAVAFAILEIVITIAAVALLNITFNGNFLSDTTFGLLSYYIGFYITYVSTYIAAIALVLGNLMGIGYLRGRNVKAYFGLARQYV